MSAGGDNQARGAARERKHWQEKTVRTVLGAACALAMMLLPTASYAKWGAIACGTNRGSESCASSWGWGSRSEAENYAMKLCSAKRYGCSIARWEHDTCTYGPHGSYACN